MTRAEPVHNVSVSGSRVCCKSVGDFQASPCQLWELLACTESRPVFRVEGRKQLSNSHGMITEQVLFVAPVRILFWKRWAYTEVQQTVDMRDPSCVKVDFQLMHSDMMSHLSGSWRLQQLKPASTTSNGRTRVTYCFEMWPKGVPTALRFMPGLLDAVKAAVAREAGQLLEKLAFVASKVQPGCCVLAAALQASAEVEAAGGSYKCLLLRQSGDLQAAAAAAAAEAAARRQLKQRQQQQLRQKRLALQHQVLCHALEDVLSDAEEDCFVELDSCNSDVCRMASSTIPVDSSGGGSSSSSSSCTMSEPGSERVSDSSSSGNGGCRRHSSSSSSSSNAGGSNVSSSDGGRVDALVEAMSTTFSALLQPVQ